MRSYIYIYIYIYTNYNKRFLHIFPLQLFATGWNKFICVYVFVCMCVCACVCVCVCLHVYRNVHDSVSVCASHVRVCVHVHIHECEHSQVHLCMCSHVCMCFLPFAVQPFSYPQAQGKYTLNP